MGKPTDRAKEVARANGIDEITMSRLYAQSAPVATVQVYVVDLPGGGAAFQTVIEWPVDASDDQACMIGLAIEKAGKDLATTGKVEGIPV